MSLRVSEREHLRIALERLDAGIPGLGDIQPRISQQLFVKDLRGLFQRAYDTKTIPSGLSVATMGSGKTAGMLFAWMTMNTLPGSGQFVGDDPTRNFRLMVNTPYRNACGQWHGYFTPRQDPVTGIEIKPFFDGVIDPTLSGLIRDDVNSKDRQRLYDESPIVILTTDAAMIAAQPPQAGEKRASFKPGEFIQVADEMDAEALGPKTTNFYKDTLIPATSLIGLTGTHILGNHLPLERHIFGARRPFHHTTVEQAFYDRNEIAGFLAVEVLLNGDLRGVPSGIMGPEFTEEQQREMMTYASVDELAIKIIQHGVHPVDKRPLKDLNGIYFCGGIEHARTLSEKLNAAFSAGKNSAYASPVHYKMEDDEISAVMIGHQTGVNLALTSKDMLARSYDFRDYTGTGKGGLRFVVLLAPSRSPRLVAQQGGRILRRNEDDVNLVIQMVYPGVHQALFSKAIGHRMLLHETTRYHPPAGRIQLPTIDERPWPIINGVEAVVVGAQENGVHPYRDDPRYSVSLGDQKKPSNYVTASQISKFTGIHVKVVKERLFLPLEKAYREKQENDSVISVPSTYLDRRNVNLTLPVSLIGEFDKDGKKVIAIHDSIQDDAIRFLMGVDEPILQEMVSPQRRIWISDIRKIFDRMGKLKEFDELWDKTKRIAFFPTEDEEYYHNSDRRNPGMVFGTYDVHPIINKSGELDFSAEIDIFNSNPIQALILKEDVNYSDSYVPLEEIPELRNAHFLGWHTVDNQAFNKLNEEERQKLDSLYKTLEALYNSQLKRMADYDSPIEDCTRLHVTLGGHTFTCAYKGEGDEKKFCLLFDNSKINRKAAYSQIEDRVGYTERMEKEYGAGSSRKR